MIENKELLRYISEYFELIKDTLPSDSRLTNCIKYIQHKTRRSNTSNKSISSDDNITIFYEYGNTSKKSSLNIKAKALISHIRNKKIESLGI
jgi:hypothetical protein